MKKWSWLYLIAVSHDKFVYVMEVSPAGISSIYLITCWSWLYLIEVSLDVLLYVLEVSL